MNGRKTLTKLLIAAAVGVTGLLAMTGQRPRGQSADYPSTGDLRRAEQHRPGGLPSQVFVPPGRTPVQSLQLTQVAPSFGGGGGRRSPAPPEESQRHRDPDRSRSAAPTYPNTSAFTISDSAATSVDSPAFCSNQLPAGSGKPTQPLSTFNGQPSAGVWTLTVVDTGVSSTLGTLERLEPSGHPRQPDPQGRSRALQAEEEVRDQRALHADCPSRPVALRGFTTTQARREQPRTIVPPRTRRLRRRARASSL